MLLATDTPAPMAGGKLRRHKFHRLTQILFFATKARRHEVFGRLGGLGKHCSKSKLLLRRRRTFDTETRLAQRVIKENALFVKPARMESGRWQCHLAQRWLKGEE